MKAPKVYIVVGWNYNEGYLFAWYFDKEEASEHSKRLNVENRNDDYATKIEECEAGEAMEERRCHW